MKARVIVGLAVIVAALTPWTATATATGDDEPSTGAIDIVHAEMAGTLSGNGEINAFGTLRCTSAGPLNFDILVDQPSTGGTGVHGTNTAYTCPAPGATIKWLLSAQGGPWLIDDDVTITIVVVGATVATRTEQQLLHWGLHAGGDG
jgi:hypothetical protein